MWVCVCVRACVWSFVNLSPFFFLMKQARVHLLDTEPFEDAFGPKIKRKRPKLMAVDYESLVKKADGSQGMKLLCLSG